jgi:hypothetical protein
VARQRPAASRAVAGHPSAAADLLGLPGRRRPGPREAGARDFRTPPDVLAGLDLVISIDTSVAHWPARMGKPLMLLLPRGTPTGAGWRRARADSPWYPSARLYWQTQVGDWGPLVERVKADIAAR